MSAEKRLFKEYNQLLKKPISNLQIISLQPVNQDNLYKWEAVIAKPSTDDSQYYFHGKWRLDIDIPLNYPSAPPTIKFATPILHPNINYETGEICLDILKKSSWSPAWNLHHLIVAILLLLDNPEPDSPLNIDAATLFRYDKQAFTSLAQYTIWKHGNFYDQDKSSSGVIPVLSPTMS
jgi:peroxin-4